MKRTLSLDSSSTESDDFMWSSQQKKVASFGTKQKAVPNSTQLSGATARETLNISSITSPEPQIVMIESDSNEPTTPYGFGNQHPIGPTSLKDLNLPPNPFNVLATMAVIQPDEEFNLQSPEPSNPSPIYMPSMNLSTTEGWETPQTSTYKKNVLFRG